MTQSAKADSATVASTNMTAAINEMATRLEALEAFRNSSKLPEPRGIGERNLAKNVLDMEIYVATLRNDSPPHCKQRMSKQSLTANSK